MTIISYATQNAELILRRTEGFTPKYGMILGSGLGALANEIENPIHIPYSDLQGFGDASVKGHKGILTLGTLKGVQVVCLQGRSHYYEGHDNLGMQTPIYTLNSIGCETLLITNAAASLRPEVLPGSLVIVNDHINFSFKNPLVGPNNDEFGPRFPGMENAYDAEMRTQLQELAKSLNIPLPEGVYIGVLGPSYETPAEIRAFQMWGAHLVGMSTVPEVILARHCGMKLAVISSVTNMGCGLSDEKLSHEGVLEVANKASGDLIRLLKSYMENVSAIA